MQSDQLTAINSIITSLGNPTVDPLEMETVLENFMNIYINQNALTMSQKMGHISRSVSIPDTD